jgi:hypothetical protein
MRKQKHACSMKYIMYEFRHYEWVQKYAKKPLFYIIVHISTTTSCITTGRMWGCLFTSILSGIDKFIAMTELMSGSKGCFELGDIERFGEVGEESSFLAFILSRLLGQLDPIGSELDLPYQHWR